MDREVEIFYVLYAFLVELNDNVNQFRVQNRFYFTYNLDQWYHVRLIVRPSQQNFDVFVDDMVNPLDINKGFTYTFFHNLSIGTATAGTGVGYWDGIKVTQL